MKEVRRPYLWLLAGVAVGAVVAAVGGIAALLDLDGMIAGALILVGTAGVLLSAAPLVVRIIKLFDALERHRGDLAAMAAYGAPPGIPADNEDAVAGTRRLTTLLADLGGRMALDRASPEKRLAAIVAAIDQAVVVTTESGLVSLVNAAAKTLLGTDRVAVGTSLFAALDREETVKLALAAREKGMPQTTTLETVDGRRLEARVVDLGQHGGTVYFLPMPDVDKGAVPLPQIDHDPSLHDRLPQPAAAPTAETSLADLAAVILDTETTGLDVDADRIVAVGGVCVQGLRVFRAAAIDRLVSPGVSIPRQSIAVHGITDAMVKDAPPVTALLEELAGLFENRVVVGYQIGFDLAVLAAEAERNGYPWTPPLSLDVLRLVAALEPRSSERDLDQVAERLGVTTAGRHTALGDALMTAEVFVRLIPRLAERGIHTLGDAIDLSNGAKAVIRLQKASGW